MAKEDEIIKKTRTWVKVGGIISGGLVTILTPLIIMYAEVKPQVDEAQSSAESSVEALAPAIVEIQGILDEATAWAEDADEDLGIVMDKMESLTDLDRRLVRCETYIEALSQRRSFPRAPAPVEPEYDEPDMVSSLFPEDPEPHRQVQQKARYKVPTSLKGAKAKVNARNAAKCAPDDPLCGEL